MLSRDEADVSANEVPETAEVHVYEALWTTNLTQKLKVWNDGTVKFHTFNKRLTLHDTGGILVDSLFVNRAYVNDGEELRFDRTIVELGARTGVVQQDLAPLRRKAVARQVQVQVHAQAQAHGQVQAQAHGQAQGHVLRDNGGNVAPSLGPKRRRLRPPRRGPSESPRESLEAAIATTRPKSRAHWSSDSSVVVPVARPQRSPHKNMTSTPRSASSAETTRTGISTASTGSSAQNTSASVDNSMDNSGEPRNRPTSHVSDGVGLLWDDISDFGDDFADSFAITDNLSANALDFENALLAKDALDSGLSVSDAAPAEPHPASARPGPQPESQPDTPPESRPQPKSHPDTPSEPDAPTQELLSPRVKTEPLEAWQTTTSFCDLEAQLSQALDDVHEVIVIDDSSDDEDSAEMTALLTQRRKSQPPPTDAVSFDMSSDEEDDDELLAAESTSPEPAPSAPGPRYLQEQGPWTKEALDLFVWRPPGGFADAD